MLEKDIQASIISNLTKNGWFVIKLIQTSVNGIPDLICHGNGRTVYIEVKREREKPGPLQILRHQQLAAHGIDVYVTSDPKFKL
jgi:hypothetical protein